MIRAWRLFVALLAIAATVVAAQLVRAADDQPAPPRRGGGGGLFGGAGLPGDGLLRVLRSENGRKALELTDDQKESIKKVQDEIRQDTQDAFSGLRDLSQDERRAKMAEMREKVAPKIKEAVSKITDILTPKQKDRLKELEVQAKGPAALLDKDTAEALKLSDEQKDKLKGLQDELTKAREAAVGAGASADDRRAAFAKMRDLRKDTDSKMLEVLNSDQKSQFEKMQGEKVDLDAGLNAGGGRRRGRT